MAQRKNKLDQKTLLRLAGLLPANSDFTVNFTPDLYKNIEEEFRPSFTLKPWTQSQVKEISKFYLKGDKEDENYMMKKVSTQIVGWSNFINISTGEEIPFDGNVDIIPQKCMIQIISELLRISGLTE